MDVIISVMICSSYCTKREDKKCQASRTARLVKPVTEGQIYHSSTLLLIEEWNPRQNVSCKGPLEPPCRPLGQIKVFGEFGAEQDFSLTHLPFQECLAIVEYHGLDDWWGRVAGPAREPQHWRTHQWQ